MEGEFIQSSSIEKSQILIQPLDAKNANAIQNMLDHIEGAGLPYYLIERTLMYSALEQIANNEKTPKELGQWMNEKMEQYLLDIMNVEPFDDGKYEEELAAS